MKPGKIIKGFAVNSNPKSLLTHRFEDALIFAHRLHQCQLRKGTQIPYFAHLMSVSALVLEDGGDEDQAIAALFHDAVEDQGGLDTLESIQAQFGSRVAKLVEACSESWSIPKPPWKQRKLTYLSHLKDAPVDELRIAIADKLHNARSIASDLDRCGVKTWEKFNASKEDVLWFYQQFVVQVEPRCSGVLLNDLKRICRYISNSEN